VTAGGGERHRRLEMAARAGYGGASIAAGVTEVRRRGGSGRAAAAVVLMMWGCEDAAGGVLVGDDVDFILSFFSTNVSV
jgi:hypothetical protein